MACSFSLLWPSIDRSLSRETDLRPMDGFLLWRKKENRK